MNMNCHTFYSHSGKFGAHGPLLAIVAGAVLAYPLGLAYSHLINWIPFIYLNALITVGYGFVFGLMTAFLMTRGKVRNTIVAVVCGTIVGLLAWYGAWNGCANALVKGAPALLTPEQMILFVKALLKEGYWGLGRSGGSGNITGVPLGIVWLIEGLIIVGLGSLMGYSGVAKNPFCEIHGCWLDEEKTMEKLDAFVDPNDIAAFKNGDLAPLEKAQSRVPASGRFARLTVKHSPRCDDYCALSIANVTVTADKEGKPQQEVNEIISNLWLPKSMFDYLAQFEHPTAKVTTGET